MNIKNIEELKTRIPNARGIWAYVQEIERFADCNGYTGGGFEYDGIIWECLTPAEWDDETDAETAPAVYWAHIPEGWENLT